MSIFRTALTATVLIMCGGVTGAAAIPFSGQIDVAVEILTQPTIVAQLLGVVDKSDLTREVFSGNGSAAHGAGAIGDDARLAVASDAFSVGGQFMKGFGKAETINHFLISGSASKVDVVIPIRVSGTLEAEGNGTINAEVSMQTIIRPVRPAAFTFDFEDIRLIDENDSARRTKILNEQIFIEKQAGDITRAPECDEPDITQVSQGCFDPSAFFVRKALGNTAVNIEFDDKLNGPVPNPVELKFRLEIPGVLDVGKEYAFFSSVSSRSEVVGAQSCDPAFTCPFAASDFFNTVEYEIVTPDGFDVFWGSEATDVGRPMITRDSSGSGGPGGGPGTDPDPNGVGVPEPMTLTLFGLGLFGIGVARRRRMAA